VDSFNTVASGEGDARFPSVSHSTSSLASWLYDPEETGQPEQWRLQIGVYDPAASALTMMEPFTAVPSAESLAMATSASAFGAVWLDSRWDTACDPDAPDECSVDLAFASFDAAAEPAAAEPQRVTTTGVFRSDLSIAATPTGWLVAWMAVESDSLSAFAAAIDAAGTIGTAHVISDDQPFFADSSDVSLAATSTTAVAVWSADLASVVAQVTGLDGTPTGDPITIDEDVPCAMPRIEASENGFLVTWSRKTYEDYEVYSQLLDANGAPTGSKNRLTWTTTDARGAIPAWNGSTYGVVWESDRANGSSSCVESNCRNQLFGSVLDAQGQLASEPILLSNNANDSSNAALAWDGAGWSALWEVRRELRQEVYRGRFICE